MKKESKRTVRSQNLVTRKMVMLSTKMGKFKRRMGGQGGEGGEENEFCIGQVEFEMLSFPERTSSLKYPVYNPTEPEFKRWWIHRSGSHLFRDQSKVGINYLHVPGTVLSNRMIRDLVR